MPQEEIDLEEVLSRNPQVDREKLQESRALLRDLRERGTRRKRYELDGPFGGERASVRDNVRNEARVDPD
jgi:hypothetical protein